MSRSTLFNITMAAVCWMTAWLNPSPAQENGGKVSIPATVEQARAMLDLSKMPLFPGAKAADQRAMAVLKYDAPTTAAKAFEFHKQELLKRKWNELPADVASHDPIAASFERDGFLLTVSVSGLGRQDNATVVMQQHGNVDLEQLSLPDGVEVDYVALSSATFLSEKNPEETTKLVREHFLNQGWQIYGDMADGVCVRKNAVMLICYIEADETQMDQTIIEAYTELVSVDIPPPPEHADLRYIAAPPQLSFSSKLSESDLFKFYQVELAKRGWKATTDKPQDRDGRRELIFGNPAKETLSVRIEDVDSRRTVTIDHHGAE